MTECCVPNLFCRSFHRYALMVQRTSSIINRADVYFALANELIYSRERHGRAARPTVPPQGPFGALLLFNVATAVCAGYIFQAPLTPRSS